MTKVKWILAVTIVTSFTAYAQQPATQQSTTQQQQSANTTQQSDSMRQQGNNSQQSPADTPGAARAGAQANGSNDTGEGASNTPAVSQTTTSSSGSPAVMAEQEGKGRDGTNNVQRASMNMAGSPANNLNLDDKKASDADSEMKDRQGYAQDKQLSKGNRTTESSSIPQGAVQRNSRDNAVPDKAEASNDKKANKKSAKKSRRKTSRS